MNVTIMPCLMVVSAGANNAALLAARHRIAKRTAQNWLNTCADAGYLALWKDGARITTAGYKLLGVKP